MKLNRAGTPKVYRNFYTPKQRPRARSRANAQIILLIGLIILVTILRGGR
jgi:hypothetical protein